MSSEAPALSAEQVAEMLHGILTLVDNNERRRVEAALVIALSNTQTLMQLVNVLCNNEGATAGVRQLAAVLLRKKIFSLWRSLPAEAQTQLRQLLLQQLGVEPVRMVRFAVAHVVTRLSRADAQRGDGGWPELQQAIRVSAEDPRVELRELAMVLVYSIAEVFSEENALAVLAAESVVRGLSDSEEVVQSAAVKAATVLLPFLDSNRQVRTELLRHMVPQCLQLLTSCAEHEAKTRLCVSLLDLLEQLLEDLSVKRFGPTLTAIAVALLDVMQRPSSQLRVRQSCGAALGRHTATKPKYIVSSQLLQPMIDACTSIMAEDDTIALPAADTAGAEEEALGEDGDEDEDADLLHVSTPCMIGGRLLSSLATSISSKAFTAALLPFVSRNTEDISSGPRQRKAAMIAMACLAEGNPSYLRRRLTSLLEITQCFLSDPNSVPREATAFALSYFCLHLQPEILTHHALLFKLLTPLLADPSDLVRRRVAEALDTLSENTAENLEPYVSVLLPAVMQAIGCSSLETQTALCGVISSMGMTRCPSFTAYGPHLLELLKQPLTMSSPETIALRAQATEAVGVVGASMGREAFMPYLPYFMTSVVENLRTGNAALREHSFGFLANMSELLRELFMPYLDEAITFALATVEEDKTVYSNKHLLAGAAGSVPLVLEDDADVQPLSGEPPRDPADAEDDDGGDAAEEIHLRVRTADVEEKSAAVYCIGVFAEALVEGFGQSRVERCWGPLTTLDTHYYPSVRANAMVAAAKLTKAAHGARQVNKSTEANTLNPLARRLLDDLLNHTLLSTIRDDPDKEVVAAACEALELVLSFFGPQALPYGPDDVVRACIQLWRQKASCQQLEDYDPEESDDEDGEDEGELLGEEGTTMEEVVAAYVNDTAPPASGGGSSWLQTVTPEALLRHVRLPDDHDEELMESAAEALEALAKAYGPLFEPYMTLLVPLIALYADPATRAAEDLVMATGTLAVVIQALGPAATRYFDSCIAIAFSVIESSDESTARANSAYLIRVLVETCPARFSEAQAVQRTLQALWSVAGSPEEIPEAVDNAISATCSLVRCIPLELVPLDGVMEPMLRGIPMRLDKAENTNALKTVAFFLTEQASRTAEARWLPEVIACVARTFAARTVDEHDKESLMRAVMVFVQAHAAAWQQARAAVPDELRATLQMHNL